MPKINRNVKLAVNLTGTGVGTMTPFLGVTNISPPSESTGEEDVTNYDSDGVEMLPGLFDAGEVAVEFQFDPSDATHKSVRDLGPAGTLHTWHIDIGTLKRIRFDGFVKSFPTNLNNRGKVYTGTLGIRVSGVPTWEAVPTP